MTIPRITDRRIASILRFGVFLAMFSPIESYSQPGEEAINKGDQLFITVWGYPEFTTSAIVREDGTLSIPLVGDLQAAGLRRDDFTGSLRKKLADYIQGEITITVSVLSSTTRRVTVLGSVVRPDNYPVANEVSLLELITTAGGFTSDANISRIKVFRKDNHQPATEVDLEYFMERAGIDTLPTVRAGDIVFVPRQRNFVKDAGEYLGYVVLFFALFRLTEGAID